jgi:carboxyl-terminal processing protease
MSLKIRAILVVVVGLTMGFGLSFGGGLLGDKTLIRHDDLAWEQAQFLAEVLQHVKREYVEPIDDATLLESAVRGMVRDLDAHSEYLDAGEYRDIRASTAGNYTGVGVEVAMLGGALHVIAPIADSPAARAGIRSGDELVAIDGRSIASEHMQEALLLLRGRVGSRVTLTVFRDEKMIDYQMRRQTIRVASVHKEFLSPSIGYIRISQFNDSTADELATAVDALQDAQGGILDGLLLDLRNNPGGVLDAAVEVADLFLDSGVIVTADGRSPESRFSRLAQAGDILNGNAIIVLVNSGSASAAEIVAAALQDHNRALVVGTSTFGKGLVQTVMPLSKGRAIKLTTSRYYTPSGDSIHAVGVTPDVFVGDTPGLPATRLAGALDREKDAQLTEALAQLHPRTVMHSSAQ